MGVILFGDGIMIFKLIYLLLINLFSPRKVEPVNSLHKQKEPLNLEGLNWTFILLLALVIGFFIFIWVFQLGNSYPNDLMSGDLSGY